MVSIEDREGIRVASIVGEIDASNMHLIRETLKSAAKGAEKCIVSLERCTHFDAPGIAMLINVRQDIDSGMVAVVPDGSHLRQILAESGMDRVLLVVDTIDGAIRHIKETSETPLDAALKIYV